MKTDISAACQCCSQSISSKCLSSFYLDWVSGRNRRQIAEIGRSDKVFGLPILFLRCCVHKSAQIYANHSALHQ